MSKWQAEKKEFKVKELDFEESYSIVKGERIYDGHFIAASPVGRYFIDKNGDDYESYSDIEEIGSDKTLPMAEKRVNKHHQKIILNCLEWTGQ